MKKFEINMFTKSSVGMSTEGSIRYSVLFLIISFLLSLFLSFLIYLHVLPQKSIMLEFSSDVSNTETETRINYVLVDDVFLPLKGISGNWQYDGTLFTTGGNSLSMNIVGRRYIEISLSKGPNAGIVSISQNGDLLKAINLHHEGAVNWVGNSEYIEYISIRPFINGWTVFVVIVLSLGIFVIMSKFLKRKWFVFIEKLDLVDVFIVSSIAILAIVIELSSSFMAGHSAKMWFWIMDSSYYSMNGRYVLQGLIPYVNLFDNKGPMLFFTNALGASFYNRGLLIIEPVFLVVAFWFCYFTLRLSFRRLISYFSTVFAMFIFSVVFKIGNYTESFSLPFLFIGLFVSLMAMKNKKIDTKWVILSGSAFIMSFFYRANNINTWLGSLPVLFFYFIYEKEYKLLLTYIIKFVLGCLIVIIPMMFYFVVTGSLHDYIEFNILENFYYSLIDKVSFHTQLVAFYNLVKKINFNYKSFFCLIAILYPLCQIFAKKKLQGNHFFELILYYFGSFVSIYLISFSTYQFPHYLILGIPFAAMGLGFCFNFFIDVLTSLFFKYKEVIMLSFICVFLFFSNPFIVETINLGINKNGWNRYIDNNHMGMLKVANYIQSNTSRNETFACWGQEMVFIHHALTDRKSASRYLGPSTWILFDPNTDHGRKNISKYVNELKASNPKYFVLLEQDKPAEEIYNYLYTFYEPVDISLHEKLFLFQRKD